MNPTLLQAAHQLAERLGKAHQGRSGVVATTQEIEKLQTRLAGKVPAWYLELIQTVPLVGLEFTFQEYEPDKKSDGKSRIIWETPVGTIVECLEMEPGTIIFEHGFICIASCGDDSGDPFFISIHEGDDPPVYRFYQEAEGSLEKILETGCHLVAESLSEWLENGE